MTSLALPTWPGDMLKWFRVSSVAPSKSWSQFLRFRPACQILSREQSTSPSVESAEGRQEGFEGSTTAARSPGGVGGRPPRGSTGGRPPGSSSHRGVEGYWNRFGLNNEFQKISKSLGGENGASHMSRVLNLVKLCSGPQLLEPPEVKVELAEGMYKDILAKGMKQDVNIFNILLRVYTFNEVKVVPSEFLERMKESGVRPNMGTFTQLIDAYCYQGNVGGATKLLEYMRSLDMPISERIYASLVTGHARAGDLDAAAGVLETMKRNGLIPHNVVYTSLLCAHAERGNLKEIESVFGQMRSERLFPSMMTYIQVINSLSRHGHGALTSHVLDLVKNKEWLSLDFRTLAHICLSRGEVVAPRILIRELSQHQGLQSDVLVYYVVQCVGQGQDITQVIGDLRTDADLKEFPKFYPTLLSKIVHLHKPVVVGEVNYTCPPEAGALAPHPYGSAWGDMILQLYQVAMEDEFEIKPHFYYPVLARFCSEASMDGMWQALRQILFQQLPISVVVRQYFDKTLSNAGTTVEESVQAMLGKHQEGSMEFLDDALLLILYYSASGEFSAAEQVVHHFKGSSLLSQHSLVVFTAMMHGIDKMGKLEPGFSKLIQSLKTACPSLDVEKCLFLTFQGLLRGKMVSYPEIKLLVSQLKHSGLKFNSSKLYLSLIPVLKMKDQEVFRKMSDEICRGDNNMKHLKDEELIALFQGAIRTRNFGRGVRFYSFLSPEVAGRNDVLEDYLLCLTFFRPQTSKAIALLNEMLDADHVPRHSVWLSLIHLVLKADYVAARNLIEKMKDYGMQPDARLKLALLGQLVAQDLAAAACAEFEAMVDSGEADRRSYFLMGKLWAEKGDVDKTQHCVEEGMKKSGKASLSGVDLLLTAHLKSGNFDQVQQIIESDKLTNISASTVGAVFCAYLTEGRPVDTIVSSLKKTHFRDANIYTLLFFSAVDCHNDTVAVSALESVSQLNMELFEQYLKKSSNYLEVLMRYNYHLKDMKCAYQMRTGYIMTRNHVGLQRLRKSLLDNNKSDWLWQKL